MHWRLKGLIQKSLEHVPGGESLHRWMQFRGGVMRDLAGDMERKLADFQLLAGHLRHAGVDVAGARIFELGTGWYPMLPLCLYLAGARWVVTADVRPLMGADHLTAALRFIAQNADPVAASAGKAAADVRRESLRLCSALEAGAGLGEATGGHLEYWAPADGRHTHLAPETFDVYFSNSVLQHVPASIIPDLLQEASRLLVPGGLMVNSITCCDHYALGDDRINKLNYLRFSDLEWPLWNNEFQYQNRLRAPKFVEMITEAGFKIEVNTGKAGPKQLQWLAEVPVHPDFSGYTSAELGITTLDIVARKPRF